MTALHIVDPASVLAEALTDSSPDLMRSLLQTMINALLSADADAVVGAEWGQPSPDRVTQRNGYRHRDLDTRVGTIDVQIPKLRQGTYFLNGCWKAANALITVIADCYLAGVSTRRMDKLVKTLGIHSLSKSQVSRMAADLDEHVDQFRHRPLDDAGPFTFVAADALTMKVREGGRVINAVVLVATGVNADGRREVLGLRVATSETGAAWNSFFADLVARGLGGVRLVTSDAHAGLVEAIAANLPGSGWQRSLVKMGSGGIVPLVHPHRRERTLARHGWQCRECSERGSSRCESIRAPVANWRAQAREWSSPSSCHPS